MAVSRSIHICWILGILFIVLKLTGLIGWPWWTVLIPLWGPFAAMFAIVVVVAAIEFVRGDEQ
jgi:hypothetical protein